MHRGYGGEIPGVKQLAKILTPLQGIGERVDQGA